MSGCGSPKVGSSAPAFTLKNTFGQDAPLAAFDEHVVLINYWASWCPICNAEAPHIKALAERYRDDGLRVMMINGDDEPRDVVQMFGAKHQLSTSVFMLMNGRRVMKKYGAALGHVVLIDRQGTLRYVHPSWETGGEVQLEAEIKNLL